MVCKYCGEELSGNFCTACGKPSEETRTCPHCGADSPGRFCINCGQAFDPEDAMPNSETYTSSHAYMQGNASHVKSPQNKWVALVLCILLGWLGGHQFYVSRWGMAILYLFTGGLLGVGVLIDAILILCGNFKDSRGRYLK